MGLSERLPHLLDAPDVSLAEFAAAHALPKYRVGQIRRWLFEKRAGDWDAMSDLPKGLREQLAESFRLWTASIARHTTADDGTEKLLFALADGGQVESVLLRDEVRRTICISTQVGCGMGCVFCASGLDGVDRNLTTGEIVEEMLQLQRLLAPEERLSHIVVMGMGEPLANLDRLLPALEEARRPDGLGISARRITISTVGLPPAIDRLARHEANYRLAVSLHAPNDELRNELVPINRKHPISELLDACWRYAEEYYGRFITFEYVMLDGVNDQPGHARDLARLLRGRPGKVNLIPFNPFPGTDYRRSSTAAIERFREILLTKGVRATIRRTRGDDIDAACGQLAGRVRDRRRNRLGEKLIQWPARA